MTNSRLRPPTPEFGEEITPPVPCPETLALLARRRSTLAKNLGAPGPSPEQLQDLLTLAARAPDHGKLAPWRFILFEGEARARFGALLARRLAEIEPAADASRIAFEQNRFLRAPVVVAVISSPATESKIPEWEQILSAGAVCQNLLIAANAMGFGAQWITEWYAYDEKTTAALELEEGERVAGFVYLGTAQCAAAERKRVNPSERIVSWSAHQSRPR